jgi:flavin-dependent dehydrogenase
MTSVETIIVGGGPAGAAAAIRLAAAGHEALLIERHTEPHHKVCGEFLSTETQDIVRRLDVDLGAQGAVSIDSVSIHAGKRTASAPLPFRALSLSRQRFDAALLDRAKQAGAELKRGVSVQAVTREDDGWSVRCDDGANLKARHLIVATGKHGLRGVSDRRDGSLVGLKMHLRLRSGHEASLARQVELFMLDRAYVGLELVEDGVANLCLVMAREQAAKLGPGWPALRDHLLAAHARLGARLEGAEPQFDKPLAVVCPDGGHIHYESDAAAYRVGDRLAHIPPFTGDGMAIAVASGALAAEHILAGQSPAVYLDAARALTAKPIRLAAMVSRLAASRAGRTFLVSAAALVPGLIAAVTRRTRLDRAALPIQMQNYSYASARADTGGGISARSSAG